MLNGYGFDVGANGYDTEDRLVNWSRTDNQLNQAWNLSLVGDWNSVTENGNVQARTRGPTHELLTVAGQAVTHDAKGNQTTLPPSLDRTNPLTMKWDFENKLIGADTDNDGSDDVSYTWDALLRRVGRDDGANATIYVQSGQQTIADYVQGSVPASPEATYTFASYIDEPVTRTTSSGTSYYHRNQQYSIVGLTNAAGTVTEQYAYDAYGEATLLDGSGGAFASSDNRYLYTGREWDEALGLYHYRARMYDSETGRFCSRDPIGYWDGPSFYYAFFAPHNLDPSGTSWLGGIVGGVTGVIGGVVGGAVSGAVTGATIGCVGGSIGAGAGCLAGGTVGFVVGGVIGGVVGGVGGGVVGAIGGSKDEDDGVGYGDIALGGLKTGAEFGANIGFFGGVIGGYEGSSPDDPPDDDDPDNFDPFDDGPPKGDLRRPNPSDHCPAPNDSIPNIAA